MRNDDPVEVNMVYRCRRDKSYQLEDADGRVVFLPANEVEFDRDDVYEDEDVTVTMPEWLAVDRGLV